ncbi:hypothetical protein [Chryseobacterium sp. RLHN22]|uniref:hypothetical protein n=1 Tax=Chryseobacterium sp. RLHN22 TaxID=3437885 RepID=UPI003D9B9075
MKKALLLIILFQFIVIFSQSKISKRELEIIFRKSISQTKKSKMHIGENSWKICIDKDSNEINLYETKFENYSDCCRYNNWTFYKKNKFIKNESYICSEPLLSIVTTGDDWYEVDYIDDENLILIIKSKKKTENFIVKEIQKRKDNLHIIKLIKI